MGLFSSAYPVIDAAQNITNNACGVIANGGLANTDANIIDLQDNWKPTGFYTRDQLNQIIAFAADVKGRGFDAITAAQNELQLDEHRQLLSDANDDLADADAGFRDGGQTVFITAVQKAAAQGINVIESQGLKRWLLQVLRAARNVEYVTKLVSCARPSALFGVLSALNGAADALIRAAKAVGSFVASVADAVLKIPDVIGTFLTILGYVPWFILLFGGYYAGVHTGLIKPRYDPLKFRERQVLKPWRRK